MSVRSVARRGVKALLGALALGAGMGATGVSSVTIDVAGLRSHRGMVRLCLTADPQHFPSCIGDADAVARSVPAGSGPLVIGGLAPGQYAVAVIHDENGNDRLDTFLGIPREGFGFSRNPAIGFGPPPFTAARFALGSDADRQQVRMHYLL